jgi:hypothetical protein
VPLRCPAPRVLLMPPSGDCTTINARLIGARERCGRDSRLNAHQLDPNDTRCSGRKVFSLPVESKPGCCRLRHVRLPSRVKKRDRAFRPNGPLALQKSSEDVCVKRREA